MQRIAVDLDEVLVPLLKPMAQWHRRELPRRPKYPYMYRDIFGVSEQESQRMLHEFYRSKDFLYLKPIRGSQRAMTRFRRDANKMYIVTGRQDAVRETTELWVERHFPGIFDDVILTNSFTPHEVSKVDICRSLALDTIIDDNIDTWSTTSTKSGLGTLQSIESREN
jgi:hypothetical protein